MPGTALKDLRGLRVALVHPPGSEGETLAGLLVQIGCAVTCHWPSPRGLAADVDFLLVALGSDEGQASPELLASLPAPRPAIIAVGTADNPDWLQKMLEIEPLAVLGEPARPFALLAALTLARRIWLEQQRQELKLRRLERRLAGQRQIATAKSILMKTQALSEKAAYHSIRSQAMSRRVPMEQIATAIIDAHALLSYRAEDD